MNFIIFSLLICGASAAPRPQLFQAVQKYDGNTAFAYNDGNSSRTENVNADGTISGSYSVLDANGYLRTVHYRAGKGIGFQVIGDTGVDRVTAEAARRLNENLPTPPTNPPNYGELPTAPTNPPNYGKFPAAPTNPPHFGELLAAPVNNRYQPPSNNLNARSYDGDGYRNPGFVNNPTFGYYVY